MTFDTQSVALIHVGDVRHLIASQLERSRNCTESSICFLVVSSYNAAMLMHKFEDTASHSSVADSDHANLNNVLPARILSMKDHPAFSKEYHISQ